MTDRPRECWDCGGTKFRLVGGSNDLVAVCVHCSAGFDPHATYIPDEHGREHYEVRA